MSIFGDFFSPSQDTEQQTTTTQNASFNNNTRNFSQSNLWPYLQDPFDQYRGVAFNPSAFNAYQNSAADSQAGATGYLTPGFSALTGIASNGLSPTAYQPYMNQYTQAVVDPTVAEFERLNKSAASDINGSLARSGALGNSNNNQTRASALAPILNQQKAQIAGLYSAGYNNATNTALQSNQQQLGAASGLGGLLGQYTGANNTLANIGNFRQFAPLNWQTQGASGLAPFLQGAGTNNTSSSSGSSTGTSVGNTFGTSTTNPSTFQQLAGVAGIGAALLSDERTKENIAAVGETFDGQPIYRFNYKGSPTTQIGLMAQDVEKTSPSAVGSVHGLKTVDYDKATAPSAIKGRFNSGGSVPAIPSFHGTDLSTKVAHAFQTLHGLRERAKGGAIPAYDGGGAVLGSWAPTTVSTFDPSSTAGNDVVDQAQSNQFGMDAAKASDAFMKYADTSDHSKDMTAALSNASSALGNQSAQLSGFMSKYAPQPAIQGFALGGAPDDNDPGTVDTLEPRVMPRFMPSADMTLAGVANDPGVPSAAPIVPFNPRPTAGYGTPYVPAAASVSAPARAPTPTAPSSTWDSIISSLKTSPLVSGEWTTGTGPAARALLAASGQHIGAPIAQQATTMVQEAMERRKQDEAERRAKELQAQWVKQFGLAEARQTADLTGRLPTGEATFDARKWQQSQAETKRLHDAQIQNMDPGWGLKQTVESRIALAPRFGLKPDTPEYRDWIGMGKLPMAKTQAATDYAARYDAAVQYGGKEFADSEEGRNWVLNYKTEKPSRVDTAFSTKIAELSAKDYETRVAAARDAQSKRITIDQLEAVVNDPNVYQGKWAPVVNEFKKAASALGFNMNGVAETELLRSLGNQMSLKLRSTAGGEGMPGALSDGDRKFLQAAVPGETNTRQGNQAMLYMMRKSEDYKERANTVAMDYIEQNGSNLGLAKYMTQWMNQNPMFTDEDKRKVYTLSGGKFGDLVPQPATPSSPPSFDPSRDPMGLRQ